MLFGAACKSKTPTAPTTATDLSGTWRGTISDNAAGAAQLTLSLQALAGAAGGTALSGTWQATFNTGVRTSAGVASVFPGSGANAWLIYLDPSGMPPCADRPFPFNVHGQGFELNVTQGGNRLTGRSTYRTCAETFDGTVDVSR